MFQIVHEKVIPKMYPSFFTLNSNLNILCIFICWIWQLYFIHVDLLSPPERNNFQYNNDLGQERETSTANFILLENMECLFMYLFYKCISVFSSEWDSKGKKLRA